MAGTSSGVCVRASKVIAHRASSVRALLGGIALAVIAGVGWVQAGAPGSAAPIGTQPPPNRVGASDAVRWTSLTNATVHVSPGKVLKHATVVMRDGLVVDVLFNEADQKDEPKGALAATAKEGESAAKTGDDAGEPDADAKDRAATATKEKSDAAASAKAIPGPAGAKSFDATGLHVYPGFVEPYLEVDAPRPEPEVKGAHWSARVTPQRRALDGKGVDDGLAKSMRGMGYVAAVMSPKGGIFRGQSAAVSLAQPESDAAAARPPVYRNAVYQSVALDLTNLGGGAGGAGGAGRWPGYPDSQMGAIAMVRQVLIDAAAPTLGSGEWSAVTVLNATASELNAQGGRNARQEIAQPLPMLMNADDEHEVARVSKIAREFSRPAMILGSGFEFRRLESVKASIDGLSIANAPGSKAGSGNSWEGSLILPVNFPEKPRISSVGDAEEVDLREMMTWEQAPTNPRRVLAAGINAALTTAKLKDRSRFMANVREAIRHGLKEDDALAMLTTRPAAMMGLSDQLGTIEKGKRASVIVADGPIFAKKTKLRDVWVDGVRHEINAAPIKAEGFYVVKIAGDQGGAGGAGADRIAISIDKDNAVTIRRWPATA
ncbi:MAG: amidohydrolase family protein, partial [Phycisphaerales bacterium]|nr:amidohydrolase family protein [Phycisphaerales bacterium]